MGVQQEQVAMGAMANKRSRAPWHDEHDEEDHRRQQAVADADADADDDHHMNKEEKTKKPRQLAVPWMTDEMAAMTSVLPRVLTEYTSEDAARFDEDMARTDKMLDGLAARSSRVDVVASFQRRPVTVTSRKPRVVKPYMTPGLAYDKEDEEEVVVGDCLRVTKADIKMLRSFAAGSGYVPVSERFLRNRRLITQAGADEIRKSDRLFSKLYAWSQEGAKEVLRHYDADDADANKSSHSPADDGGTCSSSMNDPSTRPAAADH